MTAQRAVGARRAAARQSMRRSRSAISTATATRDLVALTPPERLRVWRNDGGNRQRSLRVPLAARVSNRSGVGAKVELRAGSLRQKLETSSATPAVAPADSSFGLGAATAADVVRVLWPAGILQAETAPRGDAGAGAALADDHRARSQALLVPVSLHVERHAVRVRDRLHGRRRDGLLGWPGRAQHARSRRVRADPRRPAAARATAATSCA